MKFLINLLLLFTYSSAYSQSCMDCAPSTVYGKCKIQFPKKVDKDGRSCSGGSNYSFNYKGYSPSTKCYGSLLEAIQAMKSSIFCEREERLGHCKIIRFEKQDKSLRSCGYAGYGVAYKGYLASTSPCYNSLEYAMDAMDAMTACSEEDQIGQTKILYPGQVDKNNAYCADNTFGVTFRRYLVDSNCYDSIDKALLAMKEFNSKL